MSLVYLYGFVPADATTPERGLLGVGDAEVELVTLDGFAAAVSRVDPDTYDAAGLESRAADVEWMAEQGLRHEQVVAWFVDTASILPSRLLTLFSGDPVLRSNAAAEAARIRSELDRFADVREWDLKVGYRSEQLVEHLAEVSGRVRELDRRIEEATPGKRFLLEKKRRTMARAEARQAARRLAGELLESVRPLSSDVAVVPPPAEAPVVLNAALLVPRGHEAEVQDRVRREVDRLTALGLVVEYTGPWAPYRFLDAE